MKVTFNYHAVPSTFPSDISILLERNFEGFSFRIGFFHEQQYLSLYIGLLVEVIIGDAQPEIFMRSSSDLDLLRADTPEKLLEAIDLELQVLSINVFKKISYMLQKEFVDEFLEAVTPQMIYASVLPQDKAD